MNKLEELKILTEQTREYLQLGGLFNPELMEHDKVRDMILKLSKSLPDLIAVAEAAEAAHKRWESKDWKELEGTAFYMNALRDKLLPLTKDTDK